MIYALNICGTRDKALAEMCERSFFKYCQSLVFESQDLDSIGWGNGAGWEPAMMKIKAIKKLVKNYPIDETDFILCVDSDVIFTSPEVFDFIRPEYGIIGIKNFSEADTPIGPLKHFSGCSIYLLGDIARKIVSLTMDELKAIRNEFRSVNLCENEDIVLSYCAQKLGAKPFDLPHYLYNGNFEQDLQENNLKSFYHLNYAPTSFLGETVTNKWDIPKILKLKGYDLW